jgi:hypothetical protein
MKNEDKRTDDNEFLMRVEVCVEEARIFMQAARQILTRLRCA